MSPVLRTARLLRLLLRRDSLTGDPVPVPLPELTGGDDSAAARLRLERDLRDLQAAGWVICKKSSVTKGRGRPAWASISAWALLPGEALIV